MNVVLLTAFVGLVLVGMAIAFFFYTRSCSEGSSPERESLLPLEDEGFVTHGSKEPSNRS